MNTIDNDLEFLFPRASGCYLCRRVFPRSEMTRACIDGETMDLCLGCAAKRLPAVGFLTKLKGLFREKK